MREVAGREQAIFEPGIDNYKFIDVPNANYASSNYDAVTKNGCTTLLNPASSNVAV